MTALYRLLSALEGAPEVRRGEAELLVGAAVSEVLHETPLFVAEWDSVETTVHSTLAGARAYCDDIAATSGQPWDWSRDEDGVYVQFWTHPDDDRPLYPTTGTVTEVQLQRPEAEQEKDTRGAVAPAPGGSTRATVSRSAQRLAAFLGGARLGRSGGVR